ncbi:hypothetical protein LCGC14_2859370 [marine sediment metagenome]|uniref:Uncharacterized protein n=1 Tax=marine sediment metagenome TaxID=412755 RepID=A0A0F9AEJ7_9ZZZZ
MTNSWEDFKEGKITMAEYDYLTEVVEELEITEQDMSSQEYFINSLGVNSVNGKGTLYFHGKRFRKVRLRDDTICMSCKELKEESTS